MVLIYLTLVLEGLILLFLKRKSVVKVVSLNFSIILFIEVLFLFLIKFTYVNGVIYKSLFFNIIGMFYWSLNLDTLSLLFLLLTALLIVLCLLYIYNAVIINYKFLVLLLVFLQFLLFNAFLTTNLLFFYIFFESVLIPMAFIIGNWGSRQRKINAFFLFFIYTLLGSFLLLVALIMIFSHCQTLELFLIKTFKFSLLRQHFIWWCLFLGFAIKIPMVPFHVWLPEAHTEAPTIGSVLLAAVLLKLGSYGMVKFLFPLFYNVTIFYTPLILLFIFLGMFYVSLTAIRQIDIKKLIAYSSIAHMSYVVAGALVLNPISIVGSVFLMLGHGLVSAGLFFCIGFLYERYKTRNIKYFGGIALFCPKLTFIFLFLTLANTAFPGTSNFVGEVLILLPILMFNKYVDFVFLSVLAIVFSSVYAFWLFNRIFFGEYKYENVYISDLNKREFFIVFSLCVLILLLGLFPSIITQDLLLNIMLTCGLNIQN